MHVVFAGRGGRWRNRDALGLAGFDGAGVFDWGLVVLARHSVDGSARILEMTRGCARPFRGAKINEVR
jgi:hypothetical protein